MKEEKDYTYRSIRDERRYGAYWYSGLWHILRPITIALAVAVIVIGLVFSLWNRIYRD